MGAVHLVIGKPRESVEVSTNPGMAELLRLAIQESQKGRDRERLGGLRPGPGLPSDEGHVQ